MAIITLQFMFILERDASGFKLSDVDIMWHYRTKSPSYPCIIIINSLLEQLAMADTTYLAIAPHYYWVKNP
jgi:hypothetical protein